MRRSERAVPWILSALLLATYAPALARSSLLQGDLPGHLEAIRWSAAHVWPLPWGWDPRYLLGAPLGILYPPLLTWVGAALAQGVGPENALRTILTLSVAAVPPALAAAARGLGLRGPAAAWATALGVAVLWLPGPGLGGSLRQTFVAGNAANALALPIFLGFVAVLRSSLGRPGKTARASLALGGLLLSHFLLAAAAGAVLAAYAAAPLLRRRPRPALRGAAVAGQALLLAAPFLVPFTLHLREASPDGIAFSPPPSVAEWTVLAACVVALAVAGGRIRRILGPGIALAAVLWIVRGFVFPAIGEPPFRMEYHRFRLLLYLAAVPLAAGLLERRLRGARAIRALPAALVLAVGGLAVFARYDARGPAPIDLPAPVPGLEGGRILVLASPASQGGAWHALQLQVPPAMGLDGAKGLFVEASPFARAVFEAERAASGPGATPRWWAIRTAPYAEVAAWSETHLRERLAALGVTAVVAREPVSDSVRRIASGAEEDLGGGFLLYPLPSLPAGGGDGWRALPPLPRSPVPARGRGVLEIARSVAGDRVTVRFDARTGGVAILHVFAHSDWRVTRGEGSLATSPLHPSDGIRAPLLEVRGRGEVTLRHAPGTEEWLGLALGFAGIALVGALATARRRRVR